MKASAPPASAEPAVGASDPPRRPATWDDAPLQARATAVAALGVMLGLVTGLVEVKLGGQLYPLLLGISFTFALVVLLATRWVARPVERLADQLDLLARVQKPQNLSALPVTRRDEVGRIAKAIQTVGIAALRHHHEARHLRQTLDHRIETQTATATRQLKAMAMRDPLTGLGNRRSLEEHFESLVKKARASGVELVCVLIDLDKFKEVNDELGHQAGDDLLVLVANLIRGSVRGDDLTVRWGGDEFIVFMPGASLARAERFAEGTRMLLRQQVRGMYPRGPYPDLSIGLAALLADRCDSGEALLAVADQRLYEAKRRGRGCTVGLDGRTLGGGSDPRAA